MPEIFLGLAPTNTGKTHRAIERMLDHERAVIGLPLRLLAREVYDRISARVGENQVALVTGEEKRVPADPKYFVCTVEAMPEVQADFLAVDEIQLMAHPERGHVFTERLLNARGSKETWFLGARSCERLLLDLVPEARVVESPRLSALRHTRPTGLGGLPPRSAVVCFSQQKLFHLADRLRHKKGGAAVVLGALSPRVRNAQVALYQAGEVSHIVATDAIGMGLNLDLDHVAFAETSKFDGRERRDLDLGELSQIAGRAGRHLRDGTFGTLSETTALSPGAARAIEEHRLPQLTRGYFRAQPSDFSSTGALLRSIAVGPNQRGLERVRAAEDEQAFAALAAKPSVGQRAHGPAQVALLWQVASIPDYQKLLFEDHLATLEQIFLMLTSPQARVSPDWISARLAKSDRAAADIDALMFALADLRTVVYVTHQSGWVADAVHFQGRAQAMEERLGDRLHQALVARFVLTTKRSSSAKKIPDAAGSSPFAVLASLRAELAGEDPRAPESLVEAAIEAKHEAIALAGDGSLRFDGTLVGRLIAGPDPTTPEVLVSIEATPGERLRLQRRLTAYARDARAALLSFASNLDVSPPARGILYAVGQGLGCTRSAPLGEQLAILSEEDRVALSQAGLRLGTHYVYAAPLLKPEFISLRVAFVAAWLGGLGRYRWPSGREVSVPTSGFPKRDLLMMLGYPALGPRGVRVDILEKALAAQADAQGTVTPEQLGSWLGCKQKEARQVHQALSEAVLRQAPESSA